MESSDFKAKFGFEASILYRWSLLKQIKALIRKNYGIRKIDKKSTIETWTRTLFILKSYNYMRRGLENSN